MPTSSLLRLGGKTVLIDAGLGVTRSVCEQGVALTDLDLILITHLHSDHYLELGPLLHTAWTAGLRTPVPVVGPAGLDEYWRQFLASMAFDIDLRVADEGRVPLAPLADIRTMREGVIWTDGVRVTALRNHHPPIRDSFALRLEASARSVVFSGDTAPFAGLGAFCRNADLLVHEAMLTGGVDAVMKSVPGAVSTLRDHIIRSHTDARDVGRLAAESGVKSLALHHFVPDGLAGFGPAEWRAAVRENYQGPLVIAKDGERIAI